MISGVAAALPLQPKAGGSGRKTILPCDFNIGDFFPSWHTVYHQSESFHEI